MNNNHLLEPDPRAAAVRRFTDGSEPIFDRLSDHRKGIDAIDVTIIELLSREIKNSAGRCTI